MTRNPESKDAPWRFRHDLKGVLFDFDGTLTRPGTLDFPAIKRALGCPPERPILEYIGQHPPGQRASLVAVLDKHEMQAAACARPNGGAESCLRTLKEGGVLVGILTRNSLQSVRKSFQAFQTTTPLDFATIVTREDAAPKPHPEGVWIAARAMHIPPERLVVIGDYRFDIIAGKRAGAKTILLTNGKDSTMADGDPAPDHVCASFEEVLEVLSAEPLI
ncbi:MAG: HAD family hydrolase [Deltaproteobacteria bacterium]|nr:HAD family hydrolase [Deltaproteobacteria bacterium]